MIISTIFLLLSLMKRDHKSTSLVWKIVKIQFIKWHFFIVCTYFRRCNTMDLEMIRWSVSHQNGDHNQEFTILYINVLNSGLWPSFWWMTDQWIASYFIVLLHLAYISWCRLSCQKFTFHDNFLCSTSTTYLYLLM